MILLMAEPLGVLGIALATSCTTGFAFCVLLAMLHRQLERFSAMTMLIRLITYVSAAGLSVWCARWLLMLWGPGDLIMVMGPALLATVPYIMILAVLRDASLRELWSMVQALPRGAERRAGQA